MGWVKNASPEVEAISEYPKIIAICIVLSIISIAVVSTRLWIRIRARGFASDDVMAALAMIFALIYSILCIVQTKYGLGLPIALRPRANLIHYTRVNFAGRPIYQLGISFFKIALLISYLRIVSSTDKKIYRSTIWACIVLIFLAHLGCALSLVFACKPVEKSWNPLLPGHCLPAGPSFTGYAIVTIISDVIVAVLPVPLLLKLNVRNSQKIGLCGIFLLGLFTTLCSIFRYLQINRIQFGDGNSTMLVLWGTIEFNVGNVVSSLPFLAPVLKRKAQAYRSKYSYGSNGGANNAGSNNLTHKSGHDDKDGNNQFSLKNMRSSRLSRNGYGSHSRIGSSDKSGGVSVMTRSASEERILGADDGQGHAIVKTVEYDVRVGSRSGGPEQ